MTICKLYNIKNLLFPKQKLMSLDLGKKNIGIALSDANLIIASPHKVLKRKNFTKDTNELINILESNFVGGLIIGWPLNMNGTEGPMCNKVRQFTDLFLKSHDLPICFQDERLSTLAVEKKMISADISRKKRAQNVDVLAATWILQTALDILSNIKYDNKLDE